MTVTSHIQRASCVVYTDLDGTLLDHSSYQFEPALPALNVLRDRHIPVIPVTSKTRSELEPLRQRLQLDSPFIVENGAAVFIPKAVYAQPADADVKEHGPYWVKAFAPPLSYWQTVIDQLVAELPEAFTPFSQLSAQQISDLTGLTQDQAALAASRDYSDPLHWRGNDQQIERLRMLCRAYGISVVKGGRFVHLIKGSGKGKALRWTHRWLTNLAGKALPSVALGDGDNDLSMLAEVDFPVQIRSPAHSFPPFEHPNRYRTQRDGPAGWNEAMQRFIQQL